MKILSYYVNVVAIEDKGHHVVSEGATPESCSGALADAAMMLPPPAPPCHSRLLFKCTGKFCKCGFPGA